MRSVIRRSISDTARYCLRRCFAKPVEVVPAKPIRALTSNEITLIVVVRNEAERLMPFLRHYREIGITRFAIVDDRSSDGTSEMLVDQPDVDLFHSSISYAEADLGNLWRQRIAQIYGQPRWYVTVDADEFLVYQGMARHPLPALVEWLKNRKSTRLLAPMIDMYPSGNIWEAKYDPAVPPWHVANHFDAAASYEVTKSPRGIKITGGPRTRLFERQHKLMKFPLILIDRSTIFTSIHSPLPYWRNYTDAFGALLHFKFFSDFDSKARIAIEEGQYWNGSEKYRKYHAISSGKAELSAMSDRSVLYSGVESLADTNLIRPIDWR
ncbi:glycosyltransferase family 2 protein [Mesorhizobium sp. RCC_202]|uniref:glycosyltransferase family 2 protein n=1 Tax=Mesorhizobium sp. RCC_202 TaxID=3239222 RepID=UPI003524CF71